MAYKTVDTASGDLPETHSLSSADTLTPESWQASHLPTRPTNKLTTPLPYLSRTFIGLLKFWTDSWLTESISLLLSIVLLIYLMIGLGATDGQAVLSAGDGLSPNTYIVILSISCRSLMIVPVLTGMAQLRWISARRGSTLLEFQLLEQPSRGPFGALSTLIASRRFATSIGPSIVLVSLAFEAVMQQALGIATPSTLPVVTYLDITENDIWISGNYASYSVRSFDPVYGGLSAAMAGLDPNAKVSISYDTDSSCIDEYKVDPPTTAAFSPNLLSGASISPYVTVDLCTQCSNITSTLNVTRDYNDGPKGWNLSSSLPSGTSLSGDVLFFVLNASQPETGREVHSNDTMITHFEALGYVLDTGSPADTGAVPGFMPVPVAQECSVALCASVYDVQYDGTAFVEKRREQVQGVWVEHGGVYRFAPRWDDSAINEQAGFLAVTNTSIVTLTYLFNSYLSGFLTNYEERDMPFQNLIGEPAWKLLYSAFHLDQTSDFAKNISDNSAPVIVCNDFETTLTILLRTVMSEIRRLYGTLIPLDKADADVEDLNSPFYRIGWAWVAFPIALEAISTIYFIGIVVATKRAKIPLWKNSSLAVMYHGIDPTQYEASMAAEKISEMDAVAKKTKVRLAYTKLGYRLVGMEEEL